MKPAVLALAFLLTQAPEATSLLGKPLTYTLTVSNAGPTPATDAWLVDKILGLVHSVSATPSQGRCEGIGGLVGCHLGTLLPGATATVTLVVIPRLRGPLTSAAYAWSPVPDPHPANNDATTTTRVK